jgi:trans-aconitate 2-methyltransferase
MSKPAWNPALYLTYADERTRPVHELVARLSGADPKTIVDLGCGPGNSTEVLRKRWPEASVIGLDSDPEMLKVAQKADPAVTWVQADIADWSPESAPDLIFANAALHWVPDHPTLFPQLFKSLAPGGALAVQMPFNFDEPSHACMRATAALPRWSPLNLSRGAIAPLLQPEQYYDLLAPSAGHLDLWVTSYQHVMADAAAILTWVRGTGLRPFTAGLSPEDKDAFEADYLAMLEQAYPIRSDGKRLLRFPRLFLVARK